MLVYIVTYEDNYGEHIDSVFDQEEQAENYCKVMNLKSDSWYHSIHEFTLIIGNNND